MKTKPNRRGKARTLRMDADTAIAFDDMVKHLDEATRGFLYSTTREKDRMIQHILQAAFDAVVNLDANDHEPQGVSVWNDEHTDCKFHWPLAFDARPETRVERERRMMLETLSK